nr:MAG TPA: hypothetical protein [Caudoviricetes sp.]
MQPVLAFLIRVGLPTFSLFLLRSPYSLLCHVLWNTLNISLVTFCVNHFLWNFAIYFFHVVWYCYFTKLKGDISWVIFQMYLNHYE